MILVKTFSLLIPALPTLRHQKGEGIPLPRGLRESEKLCYFTHQIGTMLTRLSPPATHQTKMGYLAHPVPRPHTTPAWGGGDSRDKVTP